MYVVVPLTILTKRNKNLKIVTSNQQNKPGVNNPKDQSQFIDLSPFQKYFYTAHHLEEREALTQYTTAKNHKTDLFQENNYSATKPIHPKVIFYIIPIIKLEKKIFFF